MQQFFAILKDSFREAVDGFVIYVMLGLGTLLILVLGSITYTAETAEQALTGSDTFLRKFNLIYPDKGQSKAPTGMPGVRYGASQAEDSAGHSAAFTLDVIAEPDRAAPESHGQSFRHAVYTWHQPAGKKVDLGALRGKGKGPPRSESELEFVEPAKATAEELNAVTDEQMVAFLKSQFITFVGLSESDVTVARKPGVPEPNFKFDVRLNNLAGARGWPHTVKLFFGSVGNIRGHSLGTSLSFIQDFIVNGLGAAITLILSVVFTAFFIPNALRKGSLDLLISKPIGRVQLLVYKYIGGLIFIFILSTFTIGGVWLGMAIQSGHWNPQFLLVIPVLTFTFAIVYAVSTAVAVLTRSAIAAIILSLSLMLGLYLLGKAKTLSELDKLIGIVGMPDWLHSLIDVLNNILPRYKDLDKLTSLLIAEGTQPIGDARIHGLLEAPSWGGAIGVSLAFIALMLTLASWRLVKRDG